MPRLRSAFHIACLSTESKATLMSRKATFTFHSRLKTHLFHNPFLHSYSYSCQTAFMGLNLYWIKGTLAFVCSAPLMLSPCWALEWVGGILMTTFLPARRYASAGNRDRNVSVRLSICPSVTRRYCVKTKKASVMISAPSGSPKILVFWHQISSPNSRGFPPNGASKKGGVWKFSDFVALSVNISKTVADTAKVTVSD